MQRSSLDCDEGGQEDSIKEPFRGSGQQGKANCQQGHARVLLQDGGDTCQWPGVC